MILHSKLTCVLSTKRAEIYKKKKKKNCVDTFSNHHGKLNFVRLGYTFYNLRFFPIAYNVRPCDLSALKYSKGLGLALITPSLFPLVALLVVMAISFLGTPL